MEIERGEYDALVAERDAYKLLSDTLANDETRISHLEHQVRRLKNHRDKQQAKIMEAIEGFEWGDDAQVSVESLLELIVEALQEKNGLDDED